MRGLPLAALFALLAVPPARAAAPGAACGDEDARIAAAVAISRGAAERGRLGEATAEDRATPSAGGRAFDRLVHDCVEARARVIGDLARAFAAGARNGAFAAADAQASDVAVDLPYPAEAEREIDRQAALTLEAGPPLPGSFVYCEGPYATAGTRVFAAAPEPNGDLRFAYVSWNVWGHDLVLSGRGRRERTGWLFVSPRNPDDPTFRCAIRITRAADGSLRLVSRPGAVCGGGETADGLPAVEIDDDGFSADELEGPVTWQLDDPAMFEELATDCRR